MELLAKTNPNETIIEHTDRLIENLELLKKIYPNIQVDWGLLYLACLYHDLGKLNKDFQYKIRKKQVKNEIPHAYLSVGLLPIRDLLKVHTRQDIKVLVNAIAYHHERNFYLDIDEDLDDIDYRIRELEKQICYLNYDKTPNLKPHKFPLRYFSNNRVTESLDGEEVFYQYIKVKGLLNRIDHASSAHEQVEFKNDFLDKDLKNMLLKWENESKDKRKKVDWNQLQYFMMENRNENIIAIAQTGMGKTEAGLLWIGNNKGFFTLPLKIAINAIYDRLVKDIIKVDIENKVGILHSDSFSEYIKRNEKEEGLARYYDRTRLLSLPLTIATLDQLFDFVYRYRGFELKLATLSYSKIVIDEIQMYSPDLVAYLIYGLKFITEIGGKFAILTATFPPIFEDIMKEEGIKFKRPEPFIDGDKEIRHSVKVVDDLISAEFIMKKYRNNRKVLVICNTVKTAQELYRELESNYNPKNLNLIHSYFTKEDRARKEDEILKLGNKNSDGQGIWIGTQILEASLDIDFDLLITELSDINGLFQRLGRCYRKRNFNLQGEYNAYVFTGGNQKIRGIGFVVDKAIFNASKRAIETLDGPLSESEKLKIINNTYTKENIGDSEYYKQIEDTMGYLKSIYTNEKDKKEVTYMFRNIRNITIIPENIYFKNLNEIEKYIKILEYSKEISYTREEKARARLKLDKFTISIPYYSFNSNRNRTIDINQYESLNIYECEYDSKFGFTNLIEDLLDDPSNIW